MKTSVSRHLGGLSRGLALLFLGVTTTFGQSWYNSSWTYRKPITISHGKVSGSTNLTNLPVLISLASDSNLAASAQTSGNDVLFTDSSGTNQLNHQIELYVSSTGQLIAWVQVSTVSTTVDTVIYMYYGNPSASNQQNATQVWDTNYKAVWHFGSGTSLITNNATARVKYAMDLNPDVHQRAAHDVTVLQQDCSDPWPLPEGTLDAVFTSNFLEHLPDKAAVSTVLSNAYRCLKPGGRFIAMGPNIKYIPGAYWDFFDHYVELTELSLAEALSNTDFEIEKTVARFLPYTMSQGNLYPTWVLRLYLAMPAAWPIFGKQFLVIGQKSARTPDSSPSRVER